LRGKAGGQGDPDRFIRLTGPQCLKAALDGGKSFAQRFGQLLASDSQADPPSLTRD